MRDFTVERSTAAFYHTGEARKPGYSRTAYRVKAPETIDKTVIAWDMEGISLSGQEAPQHAVLFGCSIERDAPLVGTKLGTREMLEYIIEVGERNPHALHVGYGFKYDANMLVAGLPVEHIKRLWRDNRTTFRFDSEFVWSVHWIPGKMFTVTKRWGTKRNTRAKTTVTIYDFLSFFAKPFLDVCEELLRDELTDTEHDVIAHGKKQRGQNTWDDMPSIRHYWYEEIGLMQRVFEKFRDVMYRAGFALKEWYGPGALANYINAVHSIRPQLAGVQTTTGQLPEAVHEASKRAFSGGRFELFKTGRITGPIFSVDINSAYPHALTQLPSFETGRWVYDPHPGDVQRFGFYRIRYASPNRNPLEVRPQPLFWRDNRGLISYPDKVHGWYASPEAAVVQGMPGVEILEGWYWETEKEDRPWEFLTDMYATRQRLGKKNLLSLPFKLGPNSLYGKYAQTVGWDQKKNLPPKSHALPVAAWVTSYCRAMLWTVIRQDPSSVIAVETDSVYTTRDPRSLNLSIGDALGQWGLTTYDEIVYVQSGMYHTKTDGVWVGVKSRGMNATEFPHWKLEEYLQSLRPGEKWEDITLNTRPRFIGAGAALAMNSPLKTVHTSWRSQKRSLALGDTGKRIHVPGACTACRAGIAPTYGPHRLHINSRSDGETLSFPRKLPWEKGDQYEVVKQMERAKQIESELIQ
jgi:DNA polymerase family B